MDGVGVVGDEFCRMDVWRFRSSIGSVFPTEPHSLAASDLEHSSWVSPVYPCQQFLARKILGDTSLSRNCMIRVDDLSAIPRNQ